MADPEDVEALAVGDTQADAVYRWTIRVLYGTAIALNVWMLWEALSDDADTAVLKARVVELWDRAIRPVREAKLFRTHANQVIYEAMTIVDEAAPADG